MDGLLLDFQYRLNCDMLVPSEGITTPQKSLFLYTFYCNSSLLFCSERIKTI